MLREFMEGRIDGKTQQHEIDEILEKILKQKIQECEKALATVQRGCIEGKIVQRLLESEMSIAQVAYRHLKGTQ
jgi:ribosomal protein S3AE